MNNPWLMSARLRTLPLAFASILMGSSIANCYAPINYTLFGLLIAMATSLQVLSNFANDYGDYQKGTDQKAGRKDRMLASQKISPAQMKRALIGLSLFILGLGVFTLFYAHQQLHLSTNTIWRLFFLGVISILAAIFYTVGKKAYGYLGLGDAAVVLFFGLAPVIGIAVLYGVNLNLPVWVGALGIGLLATAVLNINNYRDLKTDAANNKQTLAVKLGSKNTLIYQRWLLILGFAGVFISFTLYLNDLLSISRSNYYIEMFLVFGVFSPTAVFLSRYYSEMRELTPGNRDGLNLQLKRVSLTIFMLSVVHFALSLYLGSMFR